MTLDQLASAVQNDIHTGLQGVGNIPYSLDQLKDDLLLQRASFLVNLYKKGALKEFEIYQKIPCITTDCQDLAKCCKGPKGIAPTVHFEIPKLVLALGEKTVKFIGAADYSIEYKVYLDTTFRYSNYRRYGNNLPFVFVDTTLNGNGKFDCFLFNATPKVLTVEIIPFNPEELSEYSCCANPEFDPTGFISSEIKTAVTEKYIRHYRQLNFGPTTNTQTA